MDPRAVKRRFKLSCHMPEFIPSACSLQVLEHENVAVLDFAKINGQRGTLPVAKNLGQRSAVANQASFRPTAQQH